MEKIKQLYKGDPKEYHKAYIKKYYIDNKELISKKAKLYRQKNRAIINEKERNDKERKEKNKALHKIWYQNNKLLLQQKARDYYTKKKDIILAKASSKYNNNKIENIIERNNDLTVNYNPTIQL